VSKIVLGCGFAGLKGRRAQSEPPFPSNARNLSFWYNGRAAIWNGVQRLGLKPEDRVLVPAYACGAEIDPLIKAA
jgi:hypothetical protein